MNLWPYLLLGAIGNPVSDRAWAIFLGCFLAAVALGLLVLSWTRWGQSKLLTKCIAIAVLAHIWLLLYAYGTRIPYGSSADGTGSQGTQLALVQSKSSVSVAWTPEDSTALPQDDESWSDPPSLQNADTTAGDPSEYPRTDSDSHSTPLWNRSLESPSVPDFALPNAQVQAPSDLSDEHLRLLGQFEEQSSTDLPLDPALLADSASSDPTSGAVLVKQPDSLAMSSDQVQRSIDPSAVESPQATATKSKSASFIPGAYRMRLAPERFAYTLENGGDANTEQAVRGALEFLAKSQSPDGSWNAQAYGAGQRAVAPSAEALYRADTGKFADTAMTGLALLAFLGAGHTHNDGGPYAACVHRGLSYLCQQQFPSGDLSGRNQIGQQPTVRYARMYSHGIAAIALAEAYALTQDQDLVVPVKNAVDYSLKAMNPRTGGWRYDFASEDPGDTSQFGWQAMLLNSASVSNAAPLGGHHRVLLQRFLDSVSTGKSGGLAVYRNLNPQSRPASEQASVAMTAEAFAMRTMLGLPMSAQATREAKQMLLSQLPGSSEPNFYYWYYATLALYQSQPHSEAWTLWNEAIKRELLATQVSQGDTAGSWDPRCIWGGHGGRIYTTALGCMCLEVYYRYLPLYQSDSLTAP
ncbi:MAG: hypothetical protein DWI26_03320 [Planctomycetota bacterium]|nr:MAG: hypothetical protein DWI26_03320 [Planctomycetota bacterium]